MRRRSRTGSKPSDTAWLNVASSAAADDARFVAIADDQIVPAPLLAHLRRRGPRLLVVVLAVNDRGESVARVALDALPDVEHRTAGRVDEHTALVAQRGKVVDRDAEGGKNDDVLRRDRAEVERAGGIGPRQNLDAHVAQASVHHRVVDDLADEIDAPIGKLATRLVGVLDRALHAVAEAEFASQPDRDVADLEREVARLEQVDDPPVVVGGELALDLGLEPESLAEIGRIGGRRHGCKSSPARVGWGHVRAPAAA